jgi:hypothetical protein
VRPGPAATPAEDHLVADVGQFIAIGDASAGMDREPAN